MKLLVLPGDGIGPEIAAPTIDVLAAADARFDLGVEVETAEIGFASLETQGTTLPQAVLDRIPQVDGVILGPVSHYSYPPRDQGGVNPSAALRTQFQLFANIRPCRSRTGLSILPRPMDVVIVRENTEGFYSDRNMFAGSGEFMPDADSAFSIRKITAVGSARVARVAFELARSRRGKVTAVHKANVLKLSDGLFLREVRKVAAEFPDVGLEEMIVDATAARLIRTPEKFDVIVTTNMFGDILSDGAAELSGSLGLGGSLNQGHDIAVAQAQHGSAPDIAGRDVANPTSLILSTAMLLRWLGHRHGSPGFAQAADAIDAAVDTVLTDPSSRTRDIGGDLGTAAFASHVIRRTKQAPTRSEPRRASPIDQKSMTEATRRTFLRPHVLRPDELQNNDRGGGARTTPLATAQRGATAFLNGMTSFDPGARIAHHLHNVTESVMVVEGDAIVDIDGERTALRTFDTTVVPANIPHHFENASKERPMRIFWTYASTEATRTIIASGERSRIDAEQGDDESGAVREVARIAILEGASERFEAAVAQAAPLFQAAHGARSLVLERSDEHPLQYQLVVTWNSVRDHTERFRGSEAFREWRRLIADSVAGTPDVAHFRTVLTAF